MKARGRQGLMPARDSLKHGNIQAMSIVYYQAKFFEVDEEGFLKDFSQWCPEWAEYSRVNQGIDSLTDEHWLLVKVLQDYYRENREPPMARMLSKTTHFKMKHIYELFPEGPGKGACKLAGLPKPKGCV
jgi:dissimilatory sulfite reductase related protein